MVNAKELNAKEKRKSSLREKRDRERGQTGAEGLVFCLRNNQEYVSSLSLSFSSLMRSFMSAWRNQNNNNNNTTNHLQSQPNRPTLSTHRWRRAQSQSQLRTHHGSPPKGKNFPTQFPSKGHFNWNFLGFLHFVDLSRHFGLKNAIPLVKFWNFMLSLNVTTCCLWNVIEYFLYRLLVMLCTINMINYVDRGAIASNGVNGSIGICDDSGICSAGSGIQ